MHHVYAIREVGSRGKYKIGHSKDVQRRREVLQTGNYRPLEMAYLLGSFENVKDAQRVEKSIHQILKAEGRQIAGEWFKVGVRRLFKALEQIGE